MTIMRFNDLTAKEIISRMTDDEFKQWQEWLNRKGYCENKQCDRCHHYLIEFEKRVLNKRRKK